MWYQIQDQQKKIHKLDFIQNKNFCALNVTIKKVKRQLTAWKKIITDHMTAERLVSGV